MWHHATFRGEELLVLGHSKVRNDCILVRLDGLPMQEREALRRIAGSDAGQETAHLIPLLQKMDSPNGGDWWSYLALKMQQRNGPVFTLPLKEIQDSLDPDQKAIFKGYGQNRTNSTYEAKKQAQQWSGGDDDIHPNRKPNPVNKNGTSPVYESDLGYKMDLLMETMADESRRTQQLLGKLITALTGDQEEEPEPKKAVPKTRKAPSTTRKNSKRQEGVISNEA